MSDFVTKMMETFGDDLKCPVCYDRFMTPPVAQCKSGHNTCSQCKEDCEQCPLCREPFVETTNRALDKILKYLLSNSIPCPNADKGCNLELSGIDFVHPEKCQFRRISCPFQDSRDICKTWSGTPKSFSVHVNAEHMNRGVLLIDETMEIKAELFLRSIQVGFSLTLNDDNCYFFYGNKGVPTTNVIVKYAPTSWLTQSKTTFFKIELREDGTGLIDSFLLKPARILENSCGEDGRIGILSEMLVDPDITVYITAKSILY